MDEITLVGDRSETAARLRKELAGVVKIEFEPIAQALNGAPGHSMMLDIDLTNEAFLPVTKNWLGRRPKGSRLICVVDRASRLQYARACGLGATDILKRPVHSREVLEALWGNLASLNRKVNKSESLKSPIIAAATNALEEMFSAACYGEPIDPSEIASGGESLNSFIESQGLATWIDVVRKHHSATFQHCLLVTGLAVGFGHAIGVSRLDRQRLSLAGMLHDVGKARIPLSILEKPGSLDPEEFSVMKRHTELGLDALQTTPGLPQEMLDMVVHHHEYLDGSGYPHGLGSHEISDLVRMMTIVDIFGALIERRSYKPPFSGVEAYKILREMGPKLDQDLVRAFRPVADQTD